MTFLTDFEQEQLRLHEAAGESLLFAFQRYQLQTLADGSVEVAAETNDDNDDGWPDGSLESWTLSYPTLESALKHTGRCRIGVSGVIVTVSLDGSELR